MTNYLHEDVKSSLEKQFPDMTTEELEVQTEKISKKLNSREEKFDEQGRRIVAENVNIIIDAPIEMVE